MEKILNKLIETNIGFTGTRKGMTQQQKEKVKELMMTLNLTEFHHGDCIGSDEEAHRIAAEHVGIKIYIHPPIDGKARAFCMGDEESFPLDYLERNREIVDDSEVLIATPSGGEELRSGTWATIRYAKKIGKKIFIIYPDGTIEKDNGKNAKQAD